MVTSTVNNKLIYTIPDKCRVCYTCVRECPAKAIKIEGGQALVINERCIGCGNCIKVCSQNAKVFRKSISDVLHLLESENDTIAIIAPSFPAEFAEIDNYEVFVGMVKALGFNKIIEVAFGADLVAKEYKKLLLTNTNKSYISSDCPAIAKYIQLYHPKLVKNLAPIISPMIATARVAKIKYGEKNKIVFIGPCIAKKEESAEIDEVLTFKELREIFELKEITKEYVKPAKFDPPFAGKGSIFPVSRGLAQTTEISDDIIKGDIIVADGRSEFQEAVKEFEEGLIKAQNLELLCCDGCIMGPGMSPNGKLYVRQKCIRNYTIQKFENLDIENWKKEIEEFVNIDLRADHQPKDQRIKMPSRDEIDEVLLKMGKLKPEDFLNCGACGYDTCEEHAIAIVKGLAENEMCLPYTIDKLHKSVEELAFSNEKLASVQMALKQSEKLASMGQLSAGIAHELNNPLGVIVMYSNIILEECPLGSPIRKDLELIVEQTNRCKNIVGGLLNFARKKQVYHEKVNIYDLIVVSIKSVIIPGNINVIINCENKNCIVELDRAQIIQVFTNFIKNSIEAMPVGGDLGILINELTDNVTINFADTGHGIDDKSLNKIFEPFYTTKSMGIGTGLGLAVTYGIVKMHKGNIEVESNTNPEIGKVGTTFKVTLPKHAMKND